MPLTPVRIDASVRTRWRAFRNYNLLTRLTIVNIISGGKVEIRCRGRGCPYRKKTFNPKGETVNASRRFRGRKLRPGAVVQVRITKPGAIGKVVSYPIKRNKVPVSALRCLPPGATRPVRC